MPKDVAIEAKYYSRLNLTIDEVQGGDESDKIVIKAWRTAAKFA